MARRFRPLRILRRFPATWGILAVTLLLFGLQVALGGSTDPETQVRLGALRTDRVLEHGEYARLLLAMFLHHGPIHLLLNMLAFVQLGPLVERIWGSGRLVTFYLVSGLFGSFFSVLFLPEGFGGSLGASGAILGLAGVLLGASWFGSDHLRVLLRELLGWRLLRAVLITFGLGIALWLVLPVVDNMAHLGGVLAGLLLALANPDAETGRGPSRLAGVALVGATLLSFGWMAVRGDQALETYDLDTARMLRVRVSRSPNSLRNVPVLVELLERYDAAGLPGEGLDVFERAVEKTREPYQLRLLAGLLLEEAPERGREIAVVVERWAAVEPENPEALNALAWHLVTRSDEGRRDPVRAEEISRRALELLGEPDDDDARQLQAAMLDTLGEILFQLGEYDEARTVQRQSLEMATELDMTEETEIAERLRKIEAASG